MEVEKCSLIDCEGKICWNPSLRVEVLPEEGVFLFSEAGNTFLKWRVYLLLSPLLQEGKYTADELASLLQKWTLPANVYFAISLLEKRNFIQEKVDLLSKETAAFCGLLNISEKLAFQRLHTAKVCIQSFTGPIDPQFFSALEEWGIKVVETPEEADFSVIFVEDYLQQELSAFNKKAFAQKHSWMPVRAYGSKIWIGPFFNSGHAGCHACLSQRLKTNRLEESCVQQKKDLPHLFPPSYAKLSVTEKWAWNLAAIEIFKRVVLEKDAVLANKVLTFDFIDLTLKEHFLARLPNCSCCREVSYDPAQNPPPLILQPEKKGGDNDEGYRCLSPEDTLKKYAHHVSPITGVVQFLEPSPEPFCPSIHVYNGGYNRALPGEYQGKNGKGFRVICGGKGTTEMQAKVSCLCESIERSSGTFRGDERRIQGSFMELKEQAIHPEDVLLYSQQQYLDRERTNPKAHRFHQISRPFSGEMLLEWSPIWSLTEQKYKYYPTPLCYYGYPKGKLKEETFLSDSNGCAAGNCIEEAILQGIFELVERDSVAIWWYNRLQRPCVEIRSFQSPFITSLLKDYTRLGREVWVLDITSDLEIPSFAALSRLKNSAKEAILFGFGTHLDPLIGVTRALTEMNQFLSRKSLLLEPDFKDDDSDADIKVVRNWLNMATVENQPWLQGIGNLSAEDFTPWKSADLLEDIKQCQNRVESLGMELLILDQTRQEIGLSVVRVIVPGMRHFWPRFAPGRLYDVPVKMGWLSEPRRESELNPTWMFL